MRVRSVVCLVACLAVCLVPASGFADLNDLARELTQAKASVKGKPEDRANKARSSVLPVARKIAALGTDEARAFLLREIQEGEKREPEVAEVCAQAVAASGDEKAVKLLVAQLPAKTPALQAGILAGLGESKASLAPFEEDLIQAARVVKHPEAKKALPRVLGRVDTPAAAQALLSLVAPRAQGKGEDAERTYRSEVRAALRETKSDAVKEWLATKAFAAAASSPGMLEVVAALAGDLKLAEARAELEGLIEHASSEVSAVALESLAKIGVGDSAAKIADALKRRGTKSGVDFLTHALDAIAGAGTPEAVEVIRGFATGSDPSLRAIAMGSLGRLPGGIGVPVILEALGDKDPSVRSNALRALYGKRSKEMIGPLIDYLGTETEKRLQVDALQILVAMTGQNMGLVSVDWKKWWEIAEAKFELPKGEPDEFTNVRAYDLEYFGIEVSSSRIGFLVDISSSMTETVPVKRRSEKEGGEDDAPGGEEGGTVVAGGGKDGAGKGNGGKDGAGKDGGGLGKGGRAMKIDVLKRELSGVIKKLPVDTHINILCFDATYRTWQKQLQPLGGNGRALAVKYVEDLKTGQGTNVFDTLEAALKDRRVDTLYLLTDGLPTRGRLTAPEAILREIAAQNRVRGATIHCIAFGEESELLKDLAAQNGGKYRFVDSY